MLILPTTQTRGKEDDPWRPTPKLRLTLAPGHRLQSLLHQLALVEPEGHEDGPGEVLLAQCFAHPPGGDAGVQLKWVKKHTGVQGVDEESLCGGGCPAAPWEITQCFPKNLSSFLPTFFLKERVLSTFSWDKVQKSTGTGTSAFSPHPPTPPGRTKWIIPEVTLPGTRCKYNKYVHARALLSRHREPAKSSVKLRRLPLRRPCGLCCTYSVLHGALEIARQDPPTKTAPSKMSK